MIFINHCVVNFWCFHALTFLCPIKVSVSFRLWALSVSIKWSKFAFDNLYSAKSRTREPQQKNYFTRILYYKREEKKMIKKRCFLSLRIMEIAKLCNKLDWRSFVRGERKMNKLPSAVCLPAIDGDSPAVWTK